ncbi:MAG: Anaerobic nitric oxide reductase transcription regulator NorR [Acidobacteria bacterium]|nr:Anaerobic nitric oxide reductase transcription regulator NorR [Acidobacteriota bacterium]
MVIPGYEVIQEIGRNDWQALFRGRRNTDRIPVLLKIPHLHLSRATSAGAIEKKLIEHEFEILRELALAGIPRVCDLIRNDGFCCLALEDCGGSPLRASLGAQSVNLDSFFKLALKLAALLAELHRREITHQSINPDNILINDETGEISLIGFGFASRGAGGPTAPPPPHLLRGALAYLSPEQTGRMNRAIDYRTDFYSLGCVFYEMLTGRPPFHSAAGPSSGSDDALELIYCHIAKTPPDPAEINPEIPKQVSNIVVKLLAKNAEDRYQSALGLKEDLALCVRDWAARGAVESFTLGERDVPDRFLIPQKLYGREAEVAELLGAFDRVCEGRAAAGSMMLVAGYSGIGKTSLIQELYKPIVRERGYFISGKFDQVARGVPFGALIQAFRALVRQLLTESEERLALWRARLSKALGAQGGVLTEVIPEIELIIGKQQPPPSLGPAEALNRFQLVFQNFIGALARQEHPLVVFLDDLQWADAATLSLLQPMLTSQEIESLFLMGAYRDNEVDAGHPLMRSLNALESAGINLQRVALGPLRLPELTMLARDTLHGELSDAEPLARLVLEKTGGNPFFVCEFLKTLKQDGFIRFDYEQCRWTYDLDAIAGAPLTDNVIDLMSRKIQRLSEKTRRALTLASCIGNQFDLSALATVSEQSPETTEGDLKEAINEGLIINCGLRIADCGLNMESGSQSGDNPQSAIRNPQSYAFLHDRVQQAAYALIPDERKQPVHLAVGRLLRSRMKNDQSEENLFDIVRHLNLGSGLMTEESERIELARLNLSAGRKAKSSTAHAAALDFFKAGSSLLAEAHWETDYDLAFALHFESAECEYLCGDFDAATAAFDLLLERAKTGLDKAGVYSLRMVQYENMSRYADALTQAREGLALFGVSFPDSAEEKQAALETEIEAIQLLIGERSIESLIELPVMTDPAIKMVMNILTDIWASTYILGDAVLARLISATMTRLSLLHGNLAESAYGYVTHAITVGPVRGDYESAYEFGKLALRVNERFNDSKRRAKIYQQFHAHVALWRRPMSDCIPYAREACRSGLEAGDFLYAAYGAGTETWPAIVANRDLAQFLRDYTPSLALIRKLKNTGFADAHQLILNWARALRGETGARLSLSAEEFDERSYAETYDGNPFFTMFHLAARLHLAYLFEEFDQAVAAAREARRIAHHLSGTIWPVLLDFWGGLALAACYGGAKQSPRSDEFIRHVTDKFATTREEERNEYLKEIRKSQANLAALAESCPENYLCPSLLLSAEIERIAGREMAALSAYEQAIRYAAQTNMIQYQALANELYARFWSGRGQTEAAAVFMTEARDNYRQWGATAKVAELERRYADLLKPQPGDKLGEAQPAAGAEAGALDFFSLMKATQAIAGEIELKKLPATLLRIAIENAGAERGSLILKHGGEHGGEFFVYTEGLTDSAEARIVPLNEADHLPKSIVNYVRRTAESIVLADAQSDDRYSGDPYIARRKPRSVMCLPALNQARLTGILYLENNKVSGAFTPDRIQVMQTLSAQAAISLENAMLYDETRQTEETLRSIVEGTAAVTGGDFFSMLVHHLAAALRVKYAFVTVCRGEPKIKARTLAFWNKDRLSDNVEYDITETPCRKALEGEICHYPEGVQHLFPNDYDLVEMRAEGYLGLPLHDAAGKVIGHLAVLDDGPMPGTARNLSLLKIFAARAGAELERLRTDAELRVAMAEVERLKNRLHEENIYLQEEIRREHNFEEIVGSSPALLAVLQQVERVAPTNATVLILGETGTGKELIARAIHNRSARKDRPLVKVNCGAISAGLVESELFGHVKGAFTGALDKRTGRFELADGGTLFLDEVGELPLETQVKLLRVLQEGEFEPVGSSKTIKVDVRIIAATNRNLEDEVKAGRFRADLFYRLNVLPLRNPPLRERREDIPQLAMFFLSRYARQFGHKVNGVSQETIELMTNYHWPGNIRELQNLIERGVVLSNGSALTIDPALLPSAQTAQAAPEIQPLAAAQAATQADGRHDATPDSPTSLEDLERQHILKALAQTNWVIEGDKGAARMLNLHPNTLRSRLKKMGIQRPKT